MPYQPVNIHGTSEIDQEIKKKKDKEKKKKEEKNVIFQVFQRYLTLTLNYERRFITDRRRVITD